MKSLIIFFCLIFGVKLLFCKESTLTLKIEGKEYENIYLRLVTISQSHFFHGKETRNGTWTFTYPDSLYQEAYWFFISSIKDSIVHNLSFKSETMKRSNAACVACFFDKNTTVLLKYDSLEKSIPNFKKILNPFSDNNFFYNEYLQVKSYEDSYFVLNLSENYELEASLHKMYYGFPFFLKKEYSYEEHVKNYETVVLNYPNSRGLMMLLGASVDRFKSKEDSWKVFNAFSQNLKDSYHGRRMANKYITTFSNIKARNAKTGIVEDIILDTNKNTLIVYSASWCIPCHKMIPLVDSVQNDLEDKINIIYVSIDQPSTQSNWIKMIENKEIKYRSLFPENLKDFNYLYNVSEIPTSFFVRPDYSFDRLDIRLESQRKKLYKEVLNSK